MNKGKPPMERSFIATTLPPSSKPFVRGAGGALKLHSSYNFVDKHECIDELRTMVGATRLKEIHEQSGVSRTTLRNWFSGKTLRPQAPTLNAVGRLFGKRLGWVDDGPPTADVTTTTTRITKGRKKWRSTKSPARSKRLRLGN